MTKTATKTAPAAKGAAQTTTAAKKVRKAATAAKAEPAKNGRLIAKVASANRSQDTIAILHDGSTHMVSDYHQFGVGVKVGQNFDELKAAYLKAKAAAKPAAKLATGVDSRNSPQSAKAVSDQSAAAKKAAPAAKPAKEAKKAERKAERAEKAAPKGDDTRKITIVDKKFTFGRDGSKRAESWASCKSAKTVADYAKAGGALKYLPRWVSAGAIKLG